MLTQETKSVKISHRLFVNKIYGVFVLEFRKDIQILRGVSVLLVVLYHLDFTFIKSGFLGVDVFFVISGFLMALLYDANDKKTFFIRRAKRLLPAYFVTIIFTTIVAAMMVTPVEYNQVFKQALFASSFSSNIGFWLQNSYFSKSDFNPLLHLWSLGVEIQFYLVVPILAFFFKRFKFSLSIVAILSLVLCFFLVTISPKTSFFMMPLRLWEFLIGYIVASKMTNNGSVIYNKYSLAGFASLMLIVCIPLMEVNGQTLSVLNGHPGLYALLVSIATAIILATGLPEKIEKNKLSNTLDLLGKYSYSIYLVHFPIIVLFLYKPFSGTILKTNSVSESMILISLIIIFSLSMYNFVEIKTKKIKNITQKILILPILAISISFIFIPVKKLTYSEKEINIFNAWSDRSTYRCGKINRILNPTSISCDLTSDITIPTANILLVGNSHADSIKIAFAKSARKSNVKLHFLVPNNPLMKGGLTPTEILTEAKSHNVSLIVVHHSPGAVTPKTINELTIRANKAGIHVSIIMPVPVWEKHIPLALYQNALSNSPLPEKSLEDYKSENRLFFDGINDIPSEKIDIYNVGEIFCANECKIENKEGQPYYFDNGHLTITGSLLLSDLFDEIIASSI